ncbi:hypothetical protein F4861DRAFT_548050 [Xylaria intraflava]|nr:hypothetical protein F4861DRAFT_548050 [Xylaria intraflava]
MATPSDMNGEEPEDDRLVPFQGGDILVPEDLAADIAKHEAQPADVAFYNRLLFAQRQVIDNYLGQGDHLAAFRVALRFAQTDPFFTNAIRKRFGAKAVLFTDSEPALVVIEITTKTGHKHDPVLTKIVAYHLGKSMMERYKKYPFPHCVTVMERRNKDRALQDSDYIAQFETKNIQPHLDALVALMEDKQWWVDDDNGYRVRERQPVPKTSSQEGDSIRPSSTQATVEMVSGSPDLHRPASQHGSDGEQEFENKQVLSAQEDTGDEQAVGDEHDTGDEQDITAEQDTSNKQDISNKHASDSVHDSNRVKLNRGGPEKKSASQDEPKSDGEDDSGEDHDSDNDYDSKPKPRSKRVTRKRKSDSDDEYVPNKRARRSRPRRKTKSGRKTKHESDGEDEPTNKHISVNKQASVNKRTSANKQASANKRTSTNKQASDEDQDSEYQQDSGEEEESDDYDPRKRTRRSRPSRKNKRNSAAAAAKASARPRSRNPGKDKRRAHH